MNQLLVIVHFNMNWYKSTFFSAYFQVQYKLEFNSFDAMPISDLFIAKKTSETEWKLFDAYKLNHGYEIEISENGMIVEIADVDEFKVVGANFSTARRQNLNGVNVTCGLVIAYPERFTSVDDPVNNHVDVFTKASINLGHHLLQTLNIRFLFSFLHS